MVKFIQSNRVCGSANYGTINWMTSSSTVVDCAQQCLKLYPETNYIEFKDGQIPKCECDKSEKGQCDLRPSLDGAIEWTVYYVSGMFH